MAVQYENIIERVMSLPAEERLVLVEKILSSLNLPGQEEIDRLWAEEAERRVAQIAAGEVETISSETVFSDLRRKYSR